jgi:hypothetical protein
MSLPDHRITGPPGAAEHHLDHHISLTGLEKLPFYRESAASGLG